MFVSEDMRRSRGVILAVVGVVALLGFAADVIAEESSELRAGAAGRAGVVLSDGLPSGFWFEADAVGHLELSSAFYALGEVGFAVSRNVLSETLGYHDLTVKEPNDDKRFLFVIPARATFGWSIVDVFSMELGVLVGPARIEQSSTHCGEDNQWALSYGAFAGPAFHFNPLRAALHFQVTRAPIWQCTNSAANPATGQPPWPRRSDDDLGAALVGTVSYLL